VSTFTYMETNLGAALYEHVTKRNWPATDAGEREIWYRAGKLARLLATGGTEKVFDVNQRRLEILEGQWPAMIKRIQSLEDYVDIRSRELEARFQSLELLSESLVERSTDNESRIEEVDSFAGRIAALESVTAAIESGEVMEHGLSDLNDRIAELERDNTELTRQIAERRANLSGPREPWPDGPCPEPTSGTPPLITPARCDELLSKVERLVGRHKNEVTVTTDELRALILGFRHE
jgi:hypothetical protein